MIRKKIRNLCIIASMCGAAFLTGCNTGKTDGDAAGQNDAETTTDGNESEDTITEAASVSESATMESAITESATTESAGGNNNDAAETQEQYGMYVKLERTDVTSLWMQYSDVKREWEIKDPLETEEMYFSGKELADMARNENRSILVQISAQDADGNILAENSFMYDVAQEMLYVTISKEGVRCSTSENPNEGTNIPAVLTLPVLDEVDQMVMLGTSGSSMQAVQAAVKLLEWGENTGLDMDEIRDAASTWLSQRTDDLTDSMHRLSLIDDAYQKLLKDGARELLDASGCENTEILWGNAPVEPVEAIMQAAGLREEE